MESSFARSQQPESPVEHESVDGAFDREPVVHELTETELTPTPHCGPIESILRFIEEYALGEPPEMVLTPTL
jgi:hypothetical protein